MLVVTLCVVVALLLLRARERAIDELRRDTRNLTTALALYTGAIVTSIDLALVGTRDSLALLELAQQAPARADQGNQLLRTSVARIGLPVLMRVLDTDGNQVHVSEGPPTAVSSRDRDYFQAHVTRDAGLLISQPFVSRINGKAAIVFSRRIEGADGRFKGVILIGTPMDLFEKLFERFDVGSRGALILADDTGTLLARRPPAADLVGQKVLRDVGVLSLLRGGATAGVRINDAPVDGVRRMLGFERVGATRLVAGVGQSLDEWLANWRRDAAVAGTLTFLLAAVAAWLLLRTTRYAENAAERTAQLERSEERIRNILTHAPDAFIGIDPQGLITEWNQQAQATFGWERASVIGRRLADVIVPAPMRARYDAGLREFARTGTGPVVNRRVERMALHRDGHEIPVEVSIGALSTPEGFVANAFLHDISERTQAQTKLVAINKRLRDITDNLPLLISYIDQDQTLRFCNETWRAWLGVDPALIIGQPIADVLGPALYEQRRTHLQRALGGERVSFDLESIGLGVNRHLHTLYIPDVRADGAVAGIYTLVTDVTRSKKLELQLDRLANIDSLTGLPNRRRFEERLPEALARGQRDHRPMALMFLDVDHFKQINDSHGHATGDAVLQQFALRLENCVRVTDTVARLAGDEFVIILEGLSAIDDAEIAARKISAALKPSFVVGGLSLSVTASIGVAFVDTEAVSPIEVLAKADEALYQAKGAGRNTFVMSRLPGAEIILAPPAG